MLFLMKVKVMTLLLTRYYKLNVLKIINDIDNMFIERYFEREMTCQDDCKESVNNNNNEVVNDVKEGIFQWKCCFYPSCLTCIPQGNYCSIHNKDMI